MSITSFILHCHVGALGLRARVDRGQGVGLRGASAKHRWVPSRGVDATRTRLAGAERFYARLRQSCGLSRDETTYGVTTAYVKGVLDRSVLWRRDRRRRGDAEVTDV